MKNILITGANRGLGFALSKTFSNNGYFVYMVGRDKEAITKASAAVVNSMAFEADVSDQGSLEALFEYISKDNMQLDGIINNAAHVATKIIHESTYDDFVKTFKTNFYSVFLIYKYFAASLAINSKFVIISGMSAIKGRRPGHSLYSASKAALISLGDSISLEDKNLAVMTCCLGAVATESYLKDFPDADLSKVAPPELAAKGIYDKYILAKPGYSIYTREQLWNL